MKPVSLLFPPSLSAVTTQTQQSFFPLFGVLHHAVKCQGGLEECQMVSPAVGTEGLRPSVFIVVPSAEMSSAGDGGPLALPPRSARLGLPFPVSSATLGGCCSSFLGASCPVPP